MSESVPATVCTVGQYQQTLKPDLAVNLILGHFGRVLDSWTNCSESTF
jgi:hypothetical protein